MYKYRISKYNPAFKGQDGRYLKEEWTAISDIGKIFNGTRLNDIDYMKVEDSYIYAVQLILKYLSLPSLKVQKFVRSFSYEEHKKLTDPYAHLYTSELLDFYLKFQGDKVSFDEVDHLCRLQLREDVWSEMYHHRKLKIFIGYDYLVGIHSSKKLDGIISQIEALGLYVE